MPILTQFVHMVLLPSGRCTDACLAFLALSDVVDAIQRTQIGTTAADAFESSICRFLHLCKKANWSDQLHAKHHWLIHLPSHYRRVGFLPSCFVLERKHRMIKRYAQDIRNAGKKVGGYEKSVLTEVLCHTLAVLPATDAFNPSVRLVNKGQMPKALFNVLSSALGNFIDKTFCYSCTAAKLAPAGSCNRGDFVMLHNSGVPPEICKVHLHVEIHTCCFTLAEEFELKCFSDETWNARYLAKQNQVLLPTAEISHPLIHRWENETEVTVLLPCWKLRRQVEI